MEDSCMRLGRVPPPCPSAASPLMRIRQGLVVVAGCGAPCGRSRAPSGWAAGALAAAPRSWPTPSTGPDA
eukprot:6386252-Alexandrium_andersonii.AAC.1